MADSTQTGVESKVVRVEHDTLSTLLEVLKQYLASTELLLDGASENPALEHQITITRAQIRDIERAMTEN